MPPWVRRGWHGAELKMRISGLSKIARQFDGMLIDQFGIIHDGQRLYPGALKVLEHLHRLSIPIVVMTNSGKRASANRERLIAMGVPRGWFVDAVSSGEVAYAGLRGRRAFLIGKRGEDYGFDDVTFVSSIKDAEIILILGSNAPETSLDAYRRFFDKATIPAVCCNPDKLMLTPSGLQPAPGTIADLYQQMGGTVEWVGKPYRAIYEHALSLIGNPHRVLCIGDSAEHDVAGGRRAGLSTLLILTGVSQGKNLATIEPQPDYAMDAFRWMR
jgi:HAD superfamily hydrolase (TIGR01459 family)